uniref:Uncharacterized protein n=1 Tax=Hyaloperonospora arabidopsidis (strain Emoy2) TaxID=559515 RepID=M4BSX1_HYAAE
MRPRLWFAPRRLAVYKVGSSQARRWTNTRALPLGQSVSQSISLPGQRNVSGLVSPGRA